MKDRISRLTDPSRFRPGLMLAVAIGVTALFFAVIAVNVYSAHHRWVSGVFALLLSAAWMVVVLAMRRFYGAQAQAEIALRESETKYHTLIDALPHGVVIMQDEVLVFANPAAAAMFGCSGSDDLVGQPWEVVVAEREHERVRGIMQARARGEPGIPDHYSAFMRRGAHEEFPAEIFVRPFRYGGRYAVQGVVLDATERHRAEETLRESEERFRNLADTAPVLIWMAGVNRHTYYFNRTWQSFTGRNTAQEYGQGWRQGVHPEDLPHLLDTYNRAFASRRPFTVEYRLRHTDGGYRWLLDTGVPRFASEQRFTGYIGSCIDISRRLEVEQALRTQAQILDEIRDAVIVTDLDARITSWNKGAERLYGYRSDEVVGRRVSLLYADPDKLESEVIAPLFEKGTHSAVVRRRRKSGEEFDAQLYLSFSYDPQGRRQGMIGYSLDVTKRRRAEHALAESERRYRLLAESVSDIIWSTDTGLCFTYVSPSPKGLMGYTPEELLGRSVTELVASSSVSLLEAFRHQLEQALSSGSEPPSRRMIEAEARHKDGSTLTVEVSVMPDVDADGRLLGFTGATRDVSDRKRNEVVQSVLLRIAETAATAQDLETLLEETHRQFGRLIDVRNFFVALYSEPDDAYEFAFFRDEHDSSPGRSVRAPRSLTDYVRRTGKPILADGDVLETLKRAGEIEQHGTPARQWLGVPLRTNHGVIGVMAAQNYSDHTVYSPRDLEVMTLISSNVAAVIERKRAVDALIASEQQLRHSQKMEAIGRLAGGIAHDFNNLLTTILGRSEIVLQQLHNSHPLHEDVAEVANAAERAVGLTRQLLAFSRKQALQPSVLDLNAIVTDMEKMLRHIMGSHFELVTRLQPELGSIRADRSQIEQVLMNLVVNARDAMPHGGRLVIETAHVEPGDILDRQLKDMARGKWVMLAVSDNGTGMDAETKLRIFEPFFTTKDPGKGTGLGLSTVYGIVKQSGGQIWVYSEPDRGTVFRVFLPCMEVTAEPPAPSLRGD